MAKENQTMDNTKKDNSGKAAAAGATLGGIAGVASVPAIVTSAGAGAGGAAAVAAHGLAVLGGAVGVKGIMGGLIVAASTPLALGAAGGLVCYGAYKLIKKKKNKKAQQ